MTDDSIPRCIIIIVLIAAGGILSGTGTAIDNCSYTRIKTLADEGNAAARRVAEILAHKDITTLTLVTAINILYVTAIAMSAVLAAELSGPAGAAASAVVLALFVFVSAETIKRNIANSGSDRFAMIMSLPVKILSMLFIPITALFLLLRELQKGMTRHRDKKAAASESIEKTEKTETEEKFQNFIENAGKEGVLEPDIKQILYSAVEFGDLRAGDVMTKRENITALDAALPAEQIRGLLIKAEYSRLPVFRGDIDHITGILRQRDYLGCLTGGQSEPAPEKIAVQPYRVPPDIKLISLFEEMSHRRSHMAVVSGPDGTTLGIVTMEDILGKIIGENPADREKTKIPDIRGEAVRPDHEKPHDHRTAQTAVSA